MTTFCAIALLGLAQSDINDKWTQAIRGQHQVPAGFSIAAKSGSGQALTGNFSAGTSAKAVFKIVFRQAAPYFDRAPALQGAFGDAKGQPAQSNAITHGCVPSRFRQINVINTGRRA